MPVLTANFILELKTNHNKYAPRTFFDVTQGSATCSATETFSQSGVEPTVEGCDDTELGADDSHTCSVTNTVIFEGIPTLSQWSMTLMALLMLSVGFVSLRRSA